MEKKLKLFAILFGLFLIFFIAIIALSVNIQRRMLIQMVLTSALFRSPSGEITDKSKVLVIGSEGELMDARYRILKEFLAKYRSPLEPYTQQLIDAADRENIHYGLLPAIAMIESGLCKHIPQDSFNCWGWGIYGKRVTRFSSYADAIDTVARGIKKEYVAKGMNTPEAIVVRYNPSNTNNWAENVRFFYDFFQ